MNQGHTVKQIDRHVAGVLAASALVAGVLVYTPVRAQDTASASDSGVLQEVVVTAEKRESTESKTPIAMTVLSSQQIQEQGIYGLSTLSQIDPSLQFASTGIGAVFLTIRGVSSRDSTEIGDPAVPVGIDGFFMDRTYALNEATYDLQRIEVLRGPQGTLYGRNAIGGVVNYITNEPTKDYEGYVNVDFGNYGTVNTQGAVNLPLSDAVQMRIAFGTFSHNGYVEQPATNSKYNDDDSKSVRVSVKFEPFDGLTGVVYGQFLRSQGAGAGYDEIPFVENAAGTDISHNLPPGIKPFESNGLEPFKQDLTDYRLHWQFKYTDLPYDMTLTYLGGYDNTTLNNQEDLDNIATLSPATFQPIEHPRTQNEELRLASGNDQRLTWQGGLFYFNEENAVDSVYSVYPGTGISLAPGLNFDYPQVGSDSYAAYGQAAFKILDDLSFSLGARETHDDKTRNGYEYVLPALVGGTGTVPIESVGQDGAGHWTRFTWHAGLDYTPGNDTLLYGKVDTGYKAGGFNSTGTSASIPYGPETAINYEIGWKQGLLNNQLRFNADVFYENYKGYQATLSTCPTCNTSVGGIVNAGSARIDGVETNMEALLGPIGKLTLSANYLSAIFTSFDATLQQYSATGAALAVIPYNLEGMSMIQSPRWSLGGALEHVWDLPNTGSLTFQIQTSFHTAQYFSNYNWEDSRQGAYSLSNTFLQYTAPGSRYSVQAYVHNLENSQYFTNATENATGAQYEYSFGAPRTYGVMLTAYFK
jgi:iron complex outermembrane recepter protein